MQTSPCLQWPLFDSRDLLSALSPFLSINDLLQCSALSTLLHVFYDSDLTWSPRLHSAMSLVSPSVDSTALNAVVHTEPLPLGEAIQHIQQSMVERDEDIRLDGVVFDSTSGLYHVHYTKPAHELSVTNVMIKYEIVRLQWSVEEHQWIVHQQAASPAGLLAVNVHNANYRDQPVSSNTAKARYIAYRACSQHAHHSCWQLLPPSPPLSRPLHEARACYVSRRDNTVLEPSPLPPFSPLLLCVACR